MIATKKTLKTEKYPVSRERLIKIKAVVVIMNTKKEKITILLKNTTAKKLREIKKEIGSPMGFTIEKSLQKSGLIK